MMKKIGGALVLLLTLIVLQAKAQLVQNLRGKIVDENAKPVAGATVRLLNTSEATLANASGEFSLASPGAGKSVLQVSAIGFATVTMEVPGSVSTDLPAITLHSASRQLDEVVVSAQKREEILQRLPLSVTALTAKQVQDYRLWDIKEITGIVPSLYSSDPGDKRNVTSIRGIATTSYDPAVATYIDGVNQFSLDTYISPLFDVERIEVLRGPQGSLYGRNAMGGVINIITRQPTNQVTGFAEMTLGDHGRQRYTAGFKLPLVKDKLFFGAAGLYDGFNGFYTNQFNHTAYDKQHTVGGNYFLKFLPSHRWDLVLNLKHTNNRNNGPFPLVTGVDQALQEPFQLSQNATTEMIDNTLNASLSINHTNRYFNYSAQVAYQSNYRYYTNPIDADFSPIDGITLINNYGKAWNVVKVMTEELRFTNPASSVSPLQWTVGAYFFHQNSPVKQATHFGKDAALVGSPDINYSLINTTTANATGTAIYGQATYRLMNKLDLIAGLRYDHEKRNQDVLGEYQKDPDPNPVFQYRTDTAASASFHALSPKVGLAYRSSANHTLYVTYSRGFRAGGLTPLSADPSQPALFAYKPEYSNNLEAGVKNSFFSNRLLFNVTVFFTKVTDAQVPTLVLPDAVTITRNTGELTSKGFETEINAVLLKGLTLMHSLGYTHARFENLKLSENGNVVDLKGNRQIFTPDLTSMLALQYSYKISQRQDLSFVVRGEWKYLGTQYFDLANTIQQPSYNLYHAKAGLTTKTLSLFFWERNVFNEKYIGYAYDFGAVHLGDPRTYGVTFGARF
jgi:iron complex outermembrane receptor protein